MNSFRKLVLSLTLSVLFVLTNSNIIHAQVIVEQPITVAKSMTQVGQETVAAPYRAGSSVSSVALNHSGGWAIIIGSNGYSTESLPENLINRLSEANSNGETIEWVAVGDNGEWVVSTSARVTWYGLSSTMDTAISVLMDTGDYPTYVAFTYGGGWIIGYGSNAYRWEGIPAGAAARLSELNSEGTAIRGIAFGSDDSYVIWYDGGVSWNNIPTELADEINSLHNSGAYFNQIALYETTGWLILYGNGGRVGKALPSSFVREIDQY